MTKDQASGTLDRVVIAVVTWLFTYLTTKGYISASQAAEFSPLVLALLGAVYGWWTNRPKAILEAATNTGATVITTREMAEATPNNPHIVSSIAEAKEVTK